MTLKFLRIFVIVSAIFIHTSCIENKPLENDTLGASESLLSMQNAFVKATNGLTPESMRKDEWALFKIQAKLYTGDYQGLGYQAAQVLESVDGSVEIENENYNTSDLKILVTDYAEPQNGNDPEVTLQKEWACKFIKPPYFLWYGECQLPPEQNFWAFTPIAEPSEPIFFSLARYTKKEKLPQILIDENRCYGFKNCEIDVNYLEYDMVGENENGERVRLHYITSFSGELPYLASNIKTCYSTLMEVEGTKHPAQICQELINFKPGE